MDQWSNGREGVKSNMWHRTDQCAKLVINTFQGYTARGAHASNVCAAEYITINAILHRK